MASSNSSGTSSPVTTSCSSASSSLVSPFLATAPTTTPEVLSGDLIANSNKFVLITGGLGFIGSHTTLELLKFGYNVIIVDDLSNSFRDVYNRILTTAQLHFKDTGGHVPKTELHTADFTDDKAMSKVLQRHTLGNLTSGTTVTDIIGVIHFAGYKAVEESIQAPLKYYANNVSGLISFLSLLENFSIRNFIFSSSATVYGSLADGSRLLREEYCVHDTSRFTDSDGLPKTAQQGCVGITNPYGRTKFFGEAILSDLAASSPAWRIISLRYFNPIGCDALGMLGEDPKLPPSNLVPVVTRVITGAYSELSVYGNDWDTRDGSAVRDFIHVTDLARGHIAALSALTAPSLGCSINMQENYRVYNLGTGCGYSVLEVVQAMEYVTGRNIPLKIVGRRSGDVQSSIASAERAKVELGWETRQTLTDACRDVMNYLEVSLGTFQRWRLNG
jgi:UDP-glucose 4-epimerase